MIKWYRVEFKSPIHIGERGVGVESINKIIPSTTIWSAIYNALIQLDIIDPSNKPDKLFRVTSLTPLINDEPLFWIKGLEIIYSKELTPEKIKSLKDLNELNNVLKKTVLITHNLLNHKLSQCNIYINKTRDETSYKLLCDNHVYCFVELGGLGYAVLSGNDCNRRIRVVNEKKIPKNVIDRITQTAQPYHLAVVEYYTPLLLGVEILNNKQLSYNDIKSALKLLEDTGIGGERTYGFGKFKHNEYTGKINTGSNNPSHIIVQGLYSTRLDDLKKIMTSDSIYDTRIYGFRSGYSGLLRRPVLVLREGSIIPLDEYIDGVIYEDRLLYDKVYRSFDPVVVKVSI